MSERDLDARLDAVERALTDDETDLSEIRESAEAAGDVADFESRLADLESRVDELEAGLQAVRGYAGNVRAVNREVERRASAALAKAETLEAAVDDDGSIARSVQTADRPGRSGSQSRTAATNSQPNRNPSEIGESGNPSSAEPRTAGDGQRDQLGADAQQDGTGERPSRDRAGQGVASENGKRSGANGEQQSGAENGQRMGARSEKRSNAGDRHRSGMESGDATDDAETAGESQTEQFIERVRDAL